MDDQDAFAGPDGIGDFLGGAESAWTGVAGSGDVSKFDVVPAVVEDPVMGDGEPGDVREAVRGGVPGRVQRLADRPVGGYPFNGVDAPVPVFVQSQGRALVQGLVAIMDVLGVRASGVRPSAWTSMCSFFWFFTTAVAVPEAPEPFSS